MTKLSNFTSADGPCACARDATPNPPAPLSAVLVFRGFFARGFFRSRRIGDFSNFVSRVLSAFRGHTICRLPIAGQPVRFDRAFGDSPLVKRRTSRGFFWGSTL